MSHKVNFRIIEGGDDVDFEKFKTLFYDSSKKVDDVCEELGISKKRYDRLRKELIEEDGYVKKPVDKDLIYQHNPMRYITQHPKGSFCVNKQINHCKYYFGSYKTLETAKYVRDYLESHNWDEDVYHQLRKEIRGKAKKNPYTQEEYERVKNDYLAGYTVDEIIRRNRISHYKYSHISKRVRTEENLSTKPRRKF